MSKIFDPENKANSVQNSYAADGTADALAAEQFSALDTPVEPRPEVAPISTEEAPAEPRFGGGIIRAAMIVSVGNVLTRIFGLLRESILAILTGTGAVTGAFIVADNTLSIFFDLVVNGAISAALVPVLSHYAANAKDRREFWQIVNTLLTLGTIFMLIVVGILEIFADPLGRFMSAGYDKPTQDLAVDMMRVVLFAIVFLGVSSIMMAALQAMQKFAWSALSLVARNGGVVAAGFILGNWLGVWSLVVGLMVGTFMLIVLQTPGLKGNRFRLDFNWKHPAIAEILRLYRPIFLGLVVTSTMLIIDRNLASTTGDASAGAMRYATTLQQFALGLVGTAISIAILPTLSRQANDSNNNSYRQTLMQGMRLLTVLIVPATLGLLALSIPAITIIYQRGKFDDTSKWLTLIALFGYLPGLPAAAYDQMLVVAFYARRNTIAPVLVGVVSNLGYLVIALSLTKIFDWGMIGLVLANSAQQLIHMTIMFVLLNRYFKNQTVSVASQIRVLPTVFKTTLAALLMGCIAFLTSQLIMGQHTSFLIVAVALVIGVGAGVVSYVGGLRLMRVDELSLVWGAVSRKLRRA